MCQLMQTWCEFGCLMCVRVHVYVSDVCTSLSILPIFHAEELIRYCVVSLLADHRNLPHCPPKKVMTLTPPQCHPTCPALPYKTQKGACAPHVESASAERPTFRPTSPYTGWRNRTGARSARRATLARTS